MAHVVKTFDVVSRNPHRSNASSRASAAGKKGHHMAKAASPMKKAANKKRPNPFKKKFEELKAKRRHNTHRNPGLGEVIGRPADLVTTGVSALAAAVATKQLPQLILQEGNTGWQGYLANAATAGVAAWAAGTFIGKQAAQGALAGGLVIILDRFLTDRFSELGPYLSLSGVGDATSYGKLGTIRDGYYFHPGLVDANGRMITPAPVLEDAVAKVVAAYPQIAAPMAAAVQGSHMAGTPANSRAHAAGQMLQSNRYASRFTR